MREEIYARHAGQSVRPDTIADEFTEATGEGVHERTIIRDLERIGAKRVAKGQYMIPPRANGSMA